MRRLWIFLVILGAGAGSVAAQDYYECPDVPTDLPVAGTTLPWDVVLNAGGGGIYFVPLSLPPNTPVDGLHQLPTFDWLLSVEAATELPPGSGVFWDPRDVIFWDGAGVYAAWGPWAGATASIPPGSNVDAVFEGPAGAVIVSFDVPTTIGTVTYDPSDLARYAAGAWDAVPWFDASASGIPPESNLIAADRRGLRVEFSLDVPTTVGIPTYLPGEILEWNGGAISVHDPQPGWPADRSSQVNAFTWDPVLAGTNPGAIDPTLTVERLGAAQLRLKWTASDCAGGVDHGIYGGLIASLTTIGYDHTAVDCSDALPSFEEDIPLPAANSYFLVVAQNAAIEEGSYGLDSAGVERPVGIATCEPIQALGCP